MDTTIPKYLLVEDHIKQAIKQKKITDKLPGERVLAQELGFSYMTIRKAIDNLVNEGLLYKIPTRGTYVADQQAHKEKTRTIGYFLDGRIAGGLSSPYYSMIFNALEKRTSQKDYSLVYFTDTSESNLHTVLSKLDGVIASSFLRVENLIQDIKRVVPVVAIDNSVADKTIPSVIVDNWSRNHGSIPVSSCIVSKSIPSRKASATKRIRSAPASRSSRRRLASRVSGSSPVRISLKPSRPVSRLRRAFWIDSWKVRPIDMASPTDFICVVRVASAAGNFSNAKRGILVTT